MKKVSASALAALVAAITLGVAAPAGAQTCPPAVPLPTTSTVSIENGQIRINPNGPAQDAGTLQNYADDRVDEAWAGCAPPQTGCAINLALNVAFVRYVYQDPYTGEIVVDYGDLIADTDCLI